MQQDFEKIKKWFSGLHMQPVSYARQGIRPGHDWLTLLAVALAFSCVVAGSAYYVYRQIDAGTLYTIPENAIGKQTTINTAALKKVIETLDAKDTTRRALEQSTSTPADPSL